MAKVITGRKRKHIALILNKKEAALLVTVLMKIRYKGRSGSKGERGRADNDLFYALFENDGMSLAPCPHYFVGGEVKTLELTDEFVNAPEEE